MKTPPDMIKKFEDASIGLEYGKVKLTLSITQGRPRFFVTRKESFLHFEEQSPISDFQVDQSALSRVLNNQRNHEKNSEKPSDG